MSIGDIGPRTGAPGEVPLDVGDDGYPTTFDDVVIALHGATTAYLDARSIRSTRRSALRAAGRVFWSRLRFARSWCE